MAGLSLHHCVAVLMMIFIMNIPSELNISSEHTMGCVPYGGCIHKTYLNINKCKKLLKLLKPGRKRNGEMGMEKIMYNRNI